jgi:pimeloyl-ACP methyl ester carboxylesterase
MFQQTAPVLRSMDAATVVIEKYGIDENTGECPSSYLQSNTIDQRITDYLIAIAYFRQHLAGWNQKLGWAGESEGGEVASFVAPLVPETSFLALLASGGGLSMSEELPIVTRRKLSRQAASQEEADAAVADFTQHYADIRANPTPNIEWLSDGKAARNTYKYWDAVLWVKPLPLLETLNVPILLVHGTEDTSCPIESSLLVQKRFTELGKRNLELKIYPGLEHNWSDLSGESNTQQVLSETFSWIHQHL